MANAYKANRQVCDVDIRVLKTLAPFLNFEYANVTTVSLSSDSVYAMAKGAKKVGFANPIEGTMTIEAQVIPFKFYAMMADGKIYSDAAYADKVAVTATQAGAVSFQLESGSVVTGSVFVYPKGDFGDETKAIAGTFATSGEGTVTNTFTASTAGDIVADSEYIVAFIHQRDDVKRVSFNTKALPTDYRITYKTLDKDEDGEYTGFIVTAYKAAIQRNLELSFSSEGDPATTTLTSMKAYLHRNVFE
jgi:flagellar capping protein FliD